VRATWDRPASLPASYSANPTLATLAFAHGVILLTIPVAPVIAIGVWWNSQTISHYFIHRPFFQSGAANALFSAYLSVLLGVPQALWRQLHLAHHAGLRPRIHFHGSVLTEVLLVLALWGALVALAPSFFLTTYMPGYLTGVGLCALHGYYEHARGTTSHYGRLYNLLFFNDGYHAEHHADPGAHWKALPPRRDAGAPCSVWPAPLRWLDALSLEGLERLTLRLPFLQRFLLRTHRRALEPLLRSLGPVDRVAVVGGGLFPRTALLLGELLPAARLTLIDASAENVDLARPFLPRDGVAFVHARYAPGDGYDLVFIPLSYDGDCEAIYRHPPAPAVLVHDWIWRRRGDTRIVSLLLLKRLNLVRR